MSTTLYRGGRVHTRTDPFATALLVDGGVVAWVGADEAALGGTPDRVVELAGALVTPAFVDAHVHTTQTGLALGGLDLHDCRSRGELLDRLALEARSRPGEVLLGTGWDDTTWADVRPPTGEELERAAPGARVYLARVDVHSALVSPALLAQVPEGLAGRTTTGPLTLDAHHAARQAAYRSLTATDRRAAQQRTLEHAATLGIGCVHELAGPEVSGEADLVGLLGLAGEQPGVEVIGYWSDLLDTATPLRLGLRGGAGDLFVDGAVGSRTAAFHEPYADAPTHGALHHDAGRVAEHVVACTRAGLQAGFHAIGDAAVDAVVEGLERAAAALGEAAVRARRHRIEHAEHLHPRHLATLARLGVVASVQPVFDALWGGADGMYARRLGPQRAAELNPYAALARSGVPLAFGSDAPVTPLGPWEAVRAAVHHRTPEHRITARAAFAAHTRGGWRAAGIDDEGELGPGAAATFAVWQAGELLVQAPDDRVAAWSTDPRAGVPGLPDLSPGTPIPTCLRTVVRGVTVYDSGALT